ncbi:MAG: hypothetical protein FWC76_01130 [Defluviitaleaceae bacterium]|nr:hypothetical protein [Defluviitaleaceae bacterium]
MASYIEYPLQGGYINRFMVTAVDTEPREFRKVVLSGRVNEWLKKGFSIHENPCRKEMLEGRLGVVPPLPADDSPWNMHFPFGNIGVEASGFYFVPTYLRRYGKVTLRSTKAGRRPFYMETCGAATLWVNGQLVIDFTPFTRNMVKGTQFEIDLQEGDNEILFCLEDLAERDTDYYFRLRCLDEAGLAMRLPISDNVNGDALKQIENMLDDVHLDKGAYIDAPAGLRIKNPFNAPQSVTVKVFPASLGGGLAGVQPTESIEYTLAPGQDALSIASKFQGYCLLNIGCQYEGIAISRNIDTQFVSSKNLGLNEPCLDARKNHMIDLIADSPINNIYKASALLHRGRDIEFAQEIILEEIQGIVDRKDCADFHFAMLLHSYIAYGDKMSAKVKVAIEDAMIGFRYWIDEPGNDVMWFFSENHALMFHTCQYIAGGLLPDRVFESSGLTGKELQKKAEGLFETWFEDFFHEFMTEWNSPAYIPIDFLGLAVLYMHGNESLREKSRQAMDKISHCMAMFSFDGALMGTAGRIYEREIKGVYASGTTGFLHMLYNTGTTCKCDFALPTAFSDYTPPAEYEKYIAKQTKPLIYETTQGFEDHVNIYMYKDAYGILTTAVGFKPYQNGYQEHIVHCSLDKTAQVFVNHPGEGQPYGSGRPAFWAGNGILPDAKQEGNTATLHFDLGDTTLPTDATQTLLQNKVRYTHAYVPLSEFDMHITTPNAVVAQKGRGLIGIMAKNGLKLTGKGSCANIEFVSEGRENSWIVKLGNLDDYSSAKDFLKSMKI